MNRITGAAWAGAILLVVGGCGGDGGSSSPPPITANADSAAVAWNASATIDVLSNDTASQGALTISAVTVPAHGKAEVSSSAVQYTPDAGYFGTDGFSYTVQAADGTTASANVAVSVSAKLTLAGAVADAPLAGAAVTVTVGTQTIAAKADADGKYSVAVETSNPADMIAVTAAGSGTQAAIKLRSLLGDAQTVAALATEDGTVGADQLASTTVSNVSTALAAIVEEANGGTITTEAQLAALTPMAPAQLLTDAAIAIKLIADEGVALPAGVADTLALVDHPSSSATLKSLLGTQQNNGENNYFNAQKAVLTIDTLPGGAARAADGSAQTVAYFIASKAEAFFRLQIAYAMDGSAQLLAADGLHAATWSQSNGVITLVLAQPIETTTSQYNPIIGQNQSAVQSTTGYQISQLYGTPTAGVAAVQEVGTWTFAAGNVMPFEGTLLDTISATVDIATVAPLTTADFAIGTSWGGLTVGSDVNGVPIEDVLSITGAGTGAFARSGASASWSVADGVLKVVSGGVEVDYRRLIPAAAAGEEEWLASQVQSGKAVGVGVQMVAKTASGLKFIAGSDVTRQWQNGIAYDSLFDLYAGGTGVRVDGAPVSPIPLTWAVGSDGALTITQTSNGTVTSQRTWTLLGQQPGSILVMEHLTQNGTDYWRMNLYTDLGAAAP